MKTKLVRDNIPGMIIEQGYTPDFYVADEKEHIQRLCDKMSEEVSEFLENPSIEEAADMYEVWFAFISMHGMLPIDVIAEANRKRRERGGFESRFVLTAKEDEDR